MSIGKWMDKEVIVFPFSHPSSNHHSTLWLYEFDYFRYFINIEQWGLCPCAWLLTKHNVFQVYPCCHISLDFLIFKGWTVLHCIYILYFPYPLTYQWTFSLFLPLDYMNSVKMDMRVCMSLWDLNFNSSG